MARWVPFFAIAALGTASLGFGGPGGFIGGLGQIGFFVCLIATAVAAVLGSASRLNHHNGPAALPRETVAHPEGSPRAVCS